MNKVLIFDLYTQKSYDEVGGKKGIDQMGIAIAGLYSYETDQITLYHQDKISILIKEITSSTLIVGINLRKFIFKIISVYDNNDIANTPSLDILEHLKKKLSFKPTIEGLLAGTYNIKVNSYNLSHIPNLYKQGKGEEITEFCRQSIINIKKIYDFGKEKGYLFYNDETGQRWKINVEW